MSRNHDLCDDHLESPGEFSPGLFGDGAGGQNRTADTGFSVCLRHFSVFFPGLSSCFLLHTSGALPAPFYFPDFPFSVLFRLIVVAKWQHRF